jgi:chromosome segregation ATPase
MTHETLYWSAEAGPNIYSVWVQALVVLGLIATGVITLLQVRRGKTSSSEPASNTSDSAHSPTVSSSEPALIMMINSNEARSKQLEKDLQRARLQRERDLTEIATLKAEVDDVHEKNQTLAAQVRSLTTDLASALSKAETLSERLEYLEKLINRREPA